MDDMDLTEDTLESTYTRAEIAEMWNQFVVPITTDASSSPPKERKPGRESDFVTKTAMVGRHIYNMNKKKGGARKVAQQKRRRVTPKKR